jgi:hypothetical protein
VFGKIAGLGLIKKAVFEFSEAFERDIVARTFETGIFFGIF